MEPHFEKKRFGNTLIYALTCDIRTVQYNTLGSSVRLKKDIVYTKFPTNHVDSVIYRYDQVLSLDNMFCADMVHAVIKITRKIKQVMQSIKNINSCDPITKIITVCTNEFPVIERIIDRENFDNRLIYSL